MNFFKKIWELWKTPKYHACMALVLWFLFFAACFGTLAIMNNFKSVSKNPVKVYTLSNMNNYECNYKFTINNQVYELIGNRFQDKELLELLNPTATFIVTGHQKIDVLNKIDIFALRPENIASWISKALDKQTINYQNGEVKTTYRLKATDLNIASVVMKEDYIYLSVLQTTNRVKQVVLDVTPIMSKVKKKITNYKIEMEYSKLDQISDFAID